MRFYTYENNVKKHLCMKFLDFLRLQHEKLFISLIRCFHIKKQNGDLAENWQKKVALLQNGAKKMCFGRF